MSTRGWYGLINCYVRQGDNIILSIPGAMLRHDLDSKGGWQFALPIQLTMYYLLLLHMVIIYDKIISLQDKSITCMFYISCVLWRVTLFLELALSFIYSPHHKSIISTLTLCFLPKTNIATCSLYPARHAGYVYHYLCF